jgi:hypothetical protein
MSLRNRLPYFLATVVALASASSCVNLYDPIDNPHSDDQILSAARAAFDQGDYATAREYYGKLSGNQTALSESIFLDLDACGADIGAFGSALANGIDNAGLVLTIMGEKMAPSHDASCFATLLQAYKNSLTLTDSNVKGFTGLLASLAIAGEVMANSTNIQDGTLRKADFVIAGNCVSVACPGSNCAVSDGISGQATVTLSSAGSITATWGTIQGAFAAAATALSDMGITSGPTFQLINAPGTSGASNSNDSYRCALNAIGVGR